LDGDLIQIWIGMPFLMVEGNLTTTESGGSVPISFWQTCVVHRHAHSKDRPW